MSKKQILKNIEKNSKNNIKKEGKDSYFKFVTTLAVMLLLFVLTYFLIGVFYTKEIDFKSDEETEETEDISVDNSVIMLGQLLEQHDEEYYVLIYDFDDEVLSVSSWLDVYKYSDNALTVYKVDSNKKFNSKYIVSENSNPNAKNINDLKVISPTLIKVKDGNIVEYIEGEDNINDVFKNN